jgi:membrane dipeptidase
VISWIRISLPIFLLAWPLFSVASEKTSRAAVVVGEEALKIHRSGLLVDGHNDVPWSVRTKGDSSFDVIDLLKPQPDMHTDIERLRLGGVGAQFWSAYVSAETIRTGGALRQTLEQISLIYDMVDRYPDVFELALTADDIERIHRQGKIASLIGLEGGHSIENSLGSLRMLFKLGARYMTLTHSRSLDWADSATDKLVSNGLNSFGVEVVKEMNKLGMLVDISHVAPETMRAVLRLSKAPVIASHSSAYTVAPHPRNVPDDVLDALRANGGVVMINFYSAYLVPEAAAISKDEYAYYRQIEATVTDEDERRRLIDAWEEQHPMPRGTIHHVVDHIDHIVKVAGIDHVGLGSDFDGVPQVPEQLDDVSCYPLITQELLNRGYAPTDIHKILGQNVIRAMRQAEKVARAWNQP